MNHQSRIAVVSEIADLQVMLAQTQSRMARLMQKVSEWDVPAPQVAASPEPLLAIPRAQDIQGSDQGGESGALRRFGHEPRSEQKTTAEAQGRNEPASADVVAGATAGGCDEGSEPPPAPRKRGRPKKSIQEFAGKGREGDGDGGSGLCAAPLGTALEPAPAKPTSAHEAANEKQREIARHFLAKRPAPAPEPYSEPMDPTEAKPIPAAEFPAPVPVLADETVMFVADGVVHGPDGIEERLTTPQLLILTRMADGGMYPDKALSDISGATNGTFTYLMNGMRAKLAGVGVELFQPMKGFWRARRSGAS